MLEMDERKQQKPWKVIPKTFHGYSPNNEDSSFEEQKQIQFQEHKKNAITTSKYTWLTFLPKNIFEQFHRFANIYFLTIIILNWVPAINAFGKEVAMIPLLFVLSVTAVKDLFEDRRRHRSDKYVNNMSCKVYSRASNAYINETWKNIVVGDIVKLSSDDAVPADLLLLNSTEEGGICYVSTASLDGETNLKQKQPVNFLKDKKSQKDFLPSDVKFVIECEQPNNQIHNFKGGIKLLDGKGIHVDQNNLLLRGSVIRNTDVVEGLVIYAGHETKAMLNSSGPRYKRSKLERDINKDVLACVFILFILCTAGGIGCGLWTKFNVQLNDDLGLTSREPAMEGFVRFWTFIIILQVIIPVSLYVSVELVKLGQVYFINQDIELYYEPAENFSVCRATTINEDLGQIRYVFSDKTGTLTENKMILKRFTVLGTECSIAEGMCTQALEEHCRELEINTLSDCKFGFKKSWTDFFVAVSICNSVIVVDSSKSLDSTGSRDNDAFDDNTLRTAKSVHQKVKQSNSVPNGTQGFCVANNSFSNGSSSEPIVVYKNRHFYENGETFIEKCKSETGPLSSKETCSNSSLRYKSTSKTPKLSKMYSSPKYEAESPDEEALVKASAHFGYVLKARLPGCIRLEFPDSSISDFELLHTLEFESSRKRMSIIVRNPDGLIQVFCKGADTAIMNRLANRSDPLVERIESQIQEYAHEGLRTLCIAKRDLSDEEYAEWAERYSEAAFLSGNREEAMTELFDFVESDLTLLGATAVEDKLQDGVSDTIASLREAGIKVWVLTGDKRETAVNIAFSSKLLDEEMEIIEMNAKTMDECDEQLDSGLERLASLLPTYTFSPTHANKSVSMALVIDGSTLALALKNSLRQKFIDLAECCSAVLCCRTAPIQKASVVKLVRENLKAMSLAIGDGANDVSMLQMADVGVGIVGKEGMQAVMASDFVLGRFKFLKRLLLLHGHWCYDRLSRMIVYFFYKNAFFVFLLFWYQLFNGFSGSNAIDDLSLILFTLIFTSSPSIVIGILDQCTSAGQLLTRPHLYKRGQESKAYTRKLFWANMLDSLYQSVVLFALPYFTYRDTDMDMTTIGVLFHQTAVITSSLHLAIEIPSWTFIHHIFLWGSIILSYAWFLGLCAVLWSFRTYWVIYHAATTSEFWLLTIISPAAALLPRYLIRCIQAILFPSEASLSRLEALVSSKNSQHSLRRFGSETFSNYPQTTMRDDVA